MELFENGIGRPTNEVLKKRRNFKITIILVVLSVVVTGIFAVKHFFFTGIEDVEKNATAITCTFPFSKSKCSGVRDNTVRKVQEMLNNKLKYRKKLTVNGIFDDATEKTIKYYQSINFLLPTGTINAKTLEKLAKATNTKYYKIQYDKNGGTGTLNWTDNNVQVILYGCHQFLSTTKLTKKNMTHTGWTVEANGFKSFGYNTYLLDLKEGQTVKVTAYYKSSSTPTPTPSKPTVGNLLSNKGTVNITETKAVPNKLNNPVYMTNNKYWSVAFNGYKVNTKIISNGTKYANGAVATYHIKGILKQNPNINDIGKYVNNNEPAYDNMRYIKRATNNYQDFLQTIYNEIINGYPVAVKVKDTSGKEIYVIAYGLKSTDIRTSGKLSANDIATFDTSTGAWPSLGQYKECMVSGKYIVGVPKLSSAPTVKITEANIADDKAAKSRGLWLKKEKNELTILFNNKSNGYATSKAPTSSKPYNGKNILNSAVALYHIDGILGRKMNTNNLYPSSNNSTYLTAQKSTNFSKVGYIYKKYSTYQQYLQTIYNNVALGYPVAVKVRDTNARNSYVVAYAFKASKSQRGNRVNGSLSANDIAVIDTITGSWSNLGNFRPFRENDGGYALGVPISCNSKQYYEKVSGTCKTKPVATTKVSFYSVATDLKKKIKDAGAAYQNVGFSNFDNRNPVNMHVVDCSSYVSWAIYEYGKRNNIAVYKNNFKSSKDVPGIRKTLMDKSAATYIGTINQAISKKNFKPGDILISGSEGHVEIFAQMQGSTVLSYNTGSSNGIHSMAVYGDAQNNRNSYKVYRLKY